MGPLLFILYINDICNTSDIVTFCLFADDTSLLYSDKNVDLAVSILNHELQKKHHLALSQQIMYKCTQIKLYNFCARQYKYDHSFPIILNGAHLKQVRSTKFLGIHIDENLSWKSHIDVITAKISKNIGVMNRLKYVLPSSILLTLYNSFVLPYLNYSILTWESPTPKCNKLLTLQKRAVRTISKTGLHEHSGTRFANLKILKFSDLYHLNLGKFMYKHMNHVLPACFDSCFTLTSNIHSHNTRSTTKKNLHVSYSRTTI